MIRYEAITRRDLIDPQLVRAGWRLDDRAQVGLEIPVDGYDAEPWNGVTDYCVYRSNGEVLAIVEAKRQSRSPQRAREQVRHYVTEIGRRQSFQSFAFLANGLEILYWHAAPRPVSGFFSREDLERLLFIELSKTPLAEAEIDSRIAGRLYQQEAIRRISSAFERDGRRRALLVMATGTGDGGGDEAGADRAAGGVLRLPAVEGVPEGGGEGEPVGDGALGCPLPVPCRDVQHFPEDNEQFRYLTWEEEPVLMAQLTGRRADMKPKVIVALGTGMRLTEELSVRVGQVDFARGLVTAVHTKTRRNRQIPMSPAVREALVGLCMGKRPDDFVFFNPKTHDRIKGIKTAFRSACRDAEIEGLQWKHLRATFGTRLGEAGYNAFEIADLMGHSDIKTTRRYVRVTEGRKRDAVNAAMFSQARVIEMPVDLRKQA